ncbi:hypothetical protein Tco_1001864 [Tanacetum coccineum]
MMSKGKGVVIEEIMEDHDVKDAVRKGFASESENSGKLLLLKWHDSNEARKDGNVVEIEIKDSTSKVAPFFEESFNQDSLKKPKGVKDEHGMEEHVYDEFDDVMYDTNDGASTSGKEVDLKTWMGDGEVEQDNDVDWQHDPYHLVNKPKAIADLFDGLD